MAEANLPRSGIYCIRNLVSGRSYVGSSGYIAKRWRHHRRLLRQQRHHSVALQRSWDKHGPEAFVLIVLEIVDDRASLLNREQFWIGQLGAADRDLGFNVAPVAGSRAGVPQTSETRAHLSNLRQTMPHLIASSIANLSKITPEQRARSRVAVAAKLSGRARPDRRALTFPEAQEVRALKADGWTYAQLSDGYGLDRGSLCNIVKRRSYQRP